VTQNNTHIIDSFYEDWVPTSECELDAIGNYKIDSIFNILNQYNIKIKYRDARSTIYKCCLRDKIQKSHGSYFRGIPIGNTGYKI
jgi:hypothetical protein